MKNNLDKPIKYIDGLPINIGLYEIEYCPIHMHSDIEIAYVLDGAVEICYGNYQVDLHKGDLHIINSNELHDITGLTKDHQLILMRIDIAHYIIRYQSLYEMHFSTDSVCKEVIDHVKHEVLEIYKLKDSGPKAANLILELVNDVMTTLIMKFQTEKTEEFQEIKRVKETIKRILCTNHSMNKIAIDIGFDSVQEFNKKFQEIFGCTPTEYYAQAQPLTIANMDVKGRELSPKDL